MTRKGTLIDIQNVAIAVVAGLEVSGGSTRDREAISALAKQIGRLAGLALADEVDPPLVTWQDAPIGARCRGAELVDHPAHYGGADNPYEAIKVIEALGFGFNLGNAFKYMARNGKKFGVSAGEDLEKARWYLDREIARLRDV